MRVTLDSFLDPWEAHVVKARLVAEGIDATVANDQLATEWPIAFVVGGAALQVAEGDVVRARAVLAAYHRGEFALPEDADACDDGDTDDTASGCLRA